MNRCHHLWIWSQSPCSFLLHSTAHCFTSFYFIFQFQNFNISNSIAVTTCLLVPSMILNSDWKRFNGSALPLKLQKNIIFYSHLHFHFWTSYLVELSVIHQAVLSRIMILLLLKIGNCELNVKCFSQFLLKKLFNKKITNFFKKYLINYQEKKNLGKFFKKFFQKSIKIIFDLTHRSISKKIKLTWSELNLK